MGMGKQTVLTADMCEVMEAIKRQGEYTATALESNRRKGTLRRMVRLGLIKASEVTPGHITLKRNWK